MRTRRTLLSLALAAWITLFGAVPAGAQSSAAQATDPVVGDVVRMLEVGIESDLVLQWLKSSGKQPGPLSADDVIALTQAKAPKELIQALLDMSARAAPPTPRTQAPPQAPVTPAPAAPAFSEPGYVQDEGECCLVNFTVEYRVAEDVIGDNTEPPGRDLFVYVNGRFLARFSSQGNIAARGPIPFKARLAPGAHRLRVTRELHTRAGRGNSDEWQHETTASPVAIEFQIDGSANWNMDLRWIQSEFSVKRPLSWQLSRNGATVAGEKNIGKFREDWSYIFEDVEAIRDSGALSRWRARDRMKDCVEWATLWADGAPSRTAVLAELARADFEPQISTVGRID
jgi:hypothetical protein